MPNKLDPTDTDSHVHFHPRSSNLPNPTSIISLLLMVIALPVALMGIRSQLRFLSKANTGQAPATVRIDPGQIAVDPSTNPIFLSALAYGSTSEPLLTDVSYEWGISSTDTTGSLYPNSNSALARFVPTGYGRADLWVKATNQYGSAIGSIRIFVGIPVPTDSPIPTPSLPPTPTQAPQTIDDKSYRISYDGWAGATDPNASGNGYRTTNIANQALSLTTTIPSESISILGRTGPDQGRARVTIDGINKGLIDMYSATPGFGVIKTFSNLSLTNHRIVIRSVSTKNPLSTGASVGIDAIVLGSGEKYEDDHPGIKFNSWITSSDPDAISGVFRQSATKNATLSLNFEGNSITWFTKQCRSCGGDFELFVDGISQGIFNYYSPQTSWTTDQLNSLSDGPHTLTLKVLGSHNPSIRTSNRVIIDGFSTP